MNKPWIWAILSGLLLAISLAMSKGQQNDIVYAVEYNQPTNRAMTLAAPVWTPCGSPVVGTGSTMIMTHNTGGVPQCFFRPQLLEAQ